MKKSLLSLRVLGSLLLAGALPVLCSAQAVSIANGLRTVAGSGSAGYTGDGGAASAATVNAPQGVAVDAARNVFIADTGNHAVRRIDAVSGVISTVAGTGHAGIAADGSAATSSPLSSPDGLAFDSFGDLFIADTGNHRVVVVYEGGGPVATLLAALYPAVTPVVGSLYTVAGTGSAGYSGDLSAANLAALKSPASVALDVNGSVYIADTGNSRVRVVYVAGGIAQGFVSSANASVSTPTVGAIYTVAGTGTAGYGGDGANAGLALLQSPAAVRVDQPGNLYIADTGNNRLRIVYSSGTPQASLIALESPGTTATAGYIYTLAGTGVAGSAGDGGLASSAKLSSPSGFAVDAAGNLFLADTGNGLVRAVSSLSGLITTYAGSVTLGPGFSGDNLAAVGSRLQSPTDVAVDFSQTMYVADGIGNQRVRSVGAGSLFPTTAIGSTSATQTILMQVNAATSIASIVPTATPLGAEYKVTSTGSCAVDGTTVLAAGTVCPLTVSFSPLYAGARAGVLQVTTAAGAVGPFPLQGIGSGAQTVVLPGTISTIAGSGTANFAGDGGPASASSIWLPLGIAVDSVGNIFFLDDGNDRVRVIYKGGALAAQLITLENPGVTAVAGDIYTVAGTGSNGVSSDGQLATSTTLDYPNTITVDDADNVYINDGGSSRIRVVSSQTGLVSTVAGNGNAGYSGDNGPATSAMLFLAAGLTVDHFGNLYIGDTYNHRVRKVNLKTGIITTVAGPATVAVASGTDGVPATQSYSISAQGLAADDYGNLYIMDSNAYRLRVIYGGGSSNPATALILTTHKTLTAPVAGYIYNVAGTGTAGYSGDGRLATSAAIGYMYELAVDAAGNVYMPDKTYNRIRRIDAATGIIRTVVGNGSTTAAGDGGPATSASLDQPFGFALDAAGNYYISDGQNERVRFVTNSGNPLTFTSTQVGSTSVAQSLIVANNGNAAFQPTALTLTSSFVASSASTCSTSSSLPAGAVCTESVQFAPQANGATTGTLTVSGNAPSQIVALTGTGYGGVATTTTASADASVTYGQLLHLGASVVAGTGAYAVTSGTVTFTTGSTVLGTASLDATGHAALTTNAPAVGNYTVTATFNGAGTSMISQATATTQVLAATLTFTATNVSAVYNAAIPTFSYSVTGYVNNETSAIAYTGAPAISTTATQGSQIGTYPISISTGTLAAGNYTFAFVAGTLTITGGASQSISFSALGGVTYGVAPFALTATASSGLPVTYTVVSGPATISGSTVTITGVGTVVIEADQSGNADYNSATAVRQSFTVAQAPLTVTAQNALRVYGSPEPAFTSTQSGLVDNDKIGTTLVLTYSSNDTLSSPVGTYAISAALTGPASANYAVTVVPGVLTVTQAPLTLTVANATRTYGAANPTFTGSVSGLVNGDQVGTTISEQFSTTAGLTADVGSYAIQGTISGASAGQYSVTVVPGALGVTQATLTAMSNSASRLYGAANPAFSGSFTGALNGDTFTESFTTTATLTTNSGNYPIVPALSGAKINDYTVSVSAGTLTILLANSTVTLGLSAASLNYGSTEVLTATAISSTIGTPTGTVSFFDGATLLGTATLSSGVATLNASGLLAGTHAITANYAGDYNFYGNISAPQTVQVVVPQYTLSLSPNALTITSGSSASTSMTVMSQGGYVGTLNFSCGNLPAAMGCSFSPSTVTISSTVTTQTVNLTVSTSNQHAMLSMPARPGTKTGEWLALLALPLLVGRKRRKHALRLAAMLIASVPLLLPISGCAGSSPSSPQSTPSGTYQIYVQSDASTGSSSTVALSVAVH